MKYAIVLLSLAFAINAAAELAETNSAPEHDKRIPEPVQPEVEPVQPEVEPVHPPLPQQPLVQDHPVHQPPTPHDDRLFTGRSEWKVVANKPARPHLKGDNELGLPRSAPITETFTKAFKTCAKGCVPQFTGIRGYRPFDRPSCVPVGASLSLHTVICNGRPITASSNAPKFNEIINCMKSKEDLKILYRTGAHHLGNRHYNQFAYISVGCTIQRSGDGNTQSYF